MDVKHSSGTRKRRAAAKNKNQIQFDRNQVIINNDILELERELEHGLETVSGNMLCDNEILIGHTGTLKSKGAKVYNINSWHFRASWSKKLTWRCHVTQHTQWWYGREYLPGDRWNLNDTIYKNNVPRFLAFSRGFITHILFDTKSNTVSMSIDIEIPLAYLKNTIPVYNVHQIGFIPKNGGQCLKFNLPKSLAYDNGMFYEINCQSDICIDTIASTSPSCLVNEPNNSCQTILSHCFMPQSSFSTNDGLLLTTNHGVYSIDGSGIRTKLPEPLDQFMLCLELKSNQKMVWFIKHFIHPTETWSTVETFSTQILALMNLKLDMSGSLSSKPTTQFKTKSPGRHWTN